MKKETIMKKLYFINENIQLFRTKKMWAEYRAAVAEYTRLTKLLK